MEGKLSHVKSLHNTAFLVIFVELCDNVVICTWNFSKTQRKTFSIFSTVLSCKPTLNCSCVLLIVWTCVCVLPCDGLSQPVRIPTSQPVFLGWGYRSTATMTGIKLLLKMMEWTISVSPLNQVTIYCLTLRLPS